MNDIISDYIFNVMRFTRNDDESISSKSWSQSSLTNTYLAFSGWNNPADYTYTIIDIYLRNSRFMIKGQSFTYDNNNIKPTSITINSGIYTRNINTIDSFYFINRGDNKLCCLYKN